MPHEDALRWNHRYRHDERYATFATPRPFLVENAGHLPARGLGLDLAMGLGGNAAFLLERGLRVVGVDIAWVAVRQAAARLPDLMVAVIDLKHFYLPADSFDVILNLFYLQRDMWPNLRQALRPGGVLVFETLTRGMLALRPSMDQRYLLESGELRQAFADWEILVYREGWVETRSGGMQAVASLVARRPPE